MVGLREEVRTPMPRGNPSQNFSTGISPAPSGKANRGAGGDEQEADSESKLGYAKENCGNTLALRLALPLAQVLARSLVLPLAPLVAPPRPLALPIAEPLSLPLTALPLTLSLALVLSLPL